MKVEFDKQGYEVCMKAICMYQCRIESETEMDDVIVGVLRPSNA